MKRIEDIEKLSLEELEQESSKIPVPEGLKERMEAGLLAAAPAPRRNWIPYTALAVAAAIAAVMILPHSQAPKDTFDDPMLAYAEVEKAFQYIGDKMAGGVDMVREARPVADRPGEILQKINGK